jgi:hypothetical protein
MTPYLTPLCLYNPQSKLLMSKENIIKRVENDFLPIEHGFYCWWPRDINDFLSAEVLRIIADELDKRNKKCQQQIDEFF